MLATHELTPPQARRRRPRGGDGRASCVCLTPPPARPRRLRWSGAMRAPGRPRRTNGRRRRPGDADDAGCDGQAPAYAWPRRTPPPARRRRLRWSGAVACGQQMRPHRHEYDSTHERVAADTATGTGTGMASLRSPCGRTVILRPTETMPSDTFRISGATSMVWRYLIGIGASSASRSRPAPTRMPDRARAAWLDRSRGAAPAAAPSRRRAPARHRRRARDR